MTPPPTTPTARGATSRPATARGATSSADPASRTNGRPAGHRRTVRKPLVPRRVSGPADGLRRSQPGRRAPSRSPRRNARRAPAPTLGGALLARTRAFVAALPDHRLLDRLIRGRAWIPILGVLLAGIVAMQVEVLKLSAGVGRSIERSTALLSRNEQLRSSVAALSDDQRIERLAASMGMVMPAPEAINFLSARPADAAARAVTNIHAPDAAGFIASLPLIDTPAGAAAAAASAGAAPAASVGAAPTGATSTTTPTATTVTPSGG